MKEGTAVSHGKAQKLFKFFRCPLGDPVFHFLLAKIGKHCKKVLRGTMPDRGRDKSYVLINGRPIVLPHPRSFDLGPRYAIIVFE